MAKEYSCKQCGTHIRPKLRGAECAACQSHLHADQDIIAAKYLEGMKVRDPNGKIRPLIDRAVATLRVSAANNRYVAKSLGAKRRP